MGSGLWGHAVSGQGRAWPGLQMRVRRSLLGLHRGLATGRPAAGTLMIRVGVGVEFMGRGMRQGLWLLLLARGIALGKVKAKVMFLFSSLLTQLCISCSGHEGRARWSS